jgi:hypothetical protein
MNIHILGIDHDIQTFDGRRSDDEKFKFQELLETLVTDRRIQFIGDETFRERKAIAEAVAASRHISWEPIEMSTKAREELGIAREQADERHEPIFDGGLVIGSKIKRVLSDGIREEYMVWRTLTLARESSNILVLCGFQHVDELGRRFGLLGHQITSDTLCAQRWYDHPECKQWTKSGD